MRNSLRIPGTLLLLAGIAFAGDALAQWKWRDANGQIHYSDQPPPAGVPASRILTMSGSGKAAGPSAASDREAAGPANQAGAVAAASVRGDAAGTGVGAAGAARPAPGAATGQPAAATAAQATEAAAAPGRPKTAAERLNELRKQQAAREDAERKARELELLEASVAKWCEDLRGRERLLESGMRVARIDPSGEQSFMSDEERETQLQAVRRDLQAKCGGRAT